MALAISAVAAALLFQINAQAGYSYAQLFAAAKAVVLVRVVSSTSAGDTSASHFLGGAPEGSPRLLVLTSWKGPFRVGTYIDAATQQICGGLCGPDRFLIGQEMVVFTADTSQPMDVWASSVADDAEIKVAVKELTALAKKAATKTGT